VRHHQNDDKQYRRERGNAEHDPPPHKAVEFLRQRLEAGRGNRKVANPVLDEYNGNPACPGKHEQHDDRGEPHRVVAIAEEQHQHDAADRLHDDRRRGKQPVGDHHVPRRHPDGIEVPAAVRHQQEKGGAHTRAEQQDSAENVDQLGDFVECHD
jgi:hypothetical protein